MLNVGRQHHPLGCRQKKNTIQHDSRIIHKSCYDIGLDTQYSVIFKHFINFHFQAKLRRLNLNHHIHLHTHTYINYSQQHSI